MIRKILVGIVFATAACSSSSSDPTPGPADAGGGADSSTPTDSGGMPDAAPATICAELGEVDTSTAMDVPQTKMDLADIPAFAGGTIVDGTYKLTTYNRYMEGAVGTQTTRQVIIFKSGKWASKRSESMGGAERRGAGVYTTSGTSITFTTKCGDISIISAGNAYAATPSTFTFYEDNKAMGMNRTVNEWILTKQ